MSSAHRREKIILAVGYGWFSGIPEGQTNNAELIVRALDGEILHAGGTHAKICSIVVPVVWDAAFPPVEEAIRRLSPDIVLAVGTAAGASALRPEPVAVNWAEGSDASGGEGQSRACRIDERGEDVLYASLPFEEATRALLERGIPAQLGCLREAPQGALVPHRCTAGAYLCNYMNYRLAQYAKACGHPLRTGFLHVPTQPAYACAQRLSGSVPLTQPMPACMPLETMIEGTRALLTACLQD